ncbi:threonine dehydratase [Nakamurella antarctica]|uniref:L-threonine dehydratase n=1 Tax=Nakamurella antarctica TaxID=1902245 RepID=A0A3G8ZQX4_9ACTN|nr:threonine dehydratase [Nakamurella antarctica]
MPWATPFPQLSALDIDDAAARLAGVITSTPLERCERLSTMVGAEVYLKREDLQAVRSYKLRGAFNLMTQLSEAERAAGVVTASAGNHAQGVAFACKQLGIMGRIYVPRTTPVQKRDRIRAHGGSMVELVMVGDTYDEAAEAAAKEVTETGATMVHPFNDLRTIAGQGTIAREIVNQLGRVPDMVVVPVGGGGLLAGTATFYSERFGSIRVVGVEPAGAASMTAALAAGRPVPLANMDPFVDGAAVRTVGTLTSGLIAQSGVEMVTVEEGAICTAMLALYQSEGIIAEPAGALTVASLGTHYDPGVVQVQPGSTVVLVVSGGNNDVSRYGEVLERSLVHEGLKHYFLVNFPQEPGALRRFLDDVLGPDDDIALFEYVKRNNRETGPALVGIQIGSPDDLPGLLKRMSAAKMDIEKIDPDSPTFRFLT